MAMVVIVNDEADLLQICRMILEGSGHKVLTTTSWAEALEASARLQPDLVLMDWVMPDMPGDEVMRRLRGQESTRQVPVVIMSALADGAERSRNAGADGFLPKPFGAEQLEHLVRRFTNGAGAQR
jgi:CheY-like chemotaxis protein